MLNVYLCGPITGLTYEDAKDGWRVAFQKMVPSVTCLSPMRGKEYLKGEKSLAGDPDMYKDAEFPMSTAKGIITRDRWDVKRCDVVVGNFLGASSVSIGSVVEYGWADAFRKPVVTIIGREDTVHKHAFIWEISGFIVPSLGKAAAIVNRLALEGV